MGDTAEACFRYIGQATVELLTLFGREACCNSTSLKGRGRCLIDLKTIPLCAISPCSLFFSSCVILLKTRTLNKYCAFLRFSYVGHKKLKL